MKWRLWLGAAIGAWFILAPWLLGFSAHTGALWTSVVIGAIQLVASAWAGSGEIAGDHRDWRLWTVAATGAWFILQPFLLGLAGNGGETWTGVILGAVTIALSLWAMSGTAGDRAAKPGAGGGKAGA